MRRASSRIDRGCAGWRVTLAMKAGISDHVWSLDEATALLD